MCHGNNDYIELRDSIRMAGIRGLQGVIRKTVSDDLVENIWDKQHMEKIVPSLLFNMQVRKLKRKITYQCLNISILSFIRCIKQLHLVQQKKALHLRLRSWLRQFYENLSAEHHLLT